MESHLQVLLLILISLFMVQAMNENLVESPATLIKSGANCNEEQTLNSTKNYPDINDNDKDNKEKVSTVISSESLGDHQDNNKTFNGLKILELLDGSKNKNESDVSTTRAPDTDSIYRNYSALANFKGTIDPAFLKRINPHWLKFPSAKPSAHYILATIYFIMMVFGLTGNGIVIYIYLKFHSVRTPANNLIFNLAICDFIIMLEAPIFIYNSLNFGPAGGDLVCRLYAMAGATGGTAAIMTLTAISIDRYNVIVFPLNPSRSTTNMRSKLMILIIWLYSAPFTVIPLFEVGDIKYIPEGFMTACSYDYLNTSSDNYIFIFVYTIFAWVLPLIAIAYCYIHILYIVMSAKKIQSSKEKNKTEMKLAGIVIGIVGLWFLAWTPYAIISMLGIFGYKDYITPLGSMIPAIFAKTAACIDPYLYAVSHPRFRAQLEKMFCSQNATGDTQMQSSRYSRAVSQQDDCETVNLEDNVPAKKKLERATSSVCEESSISASVDEKRY